jgi:hypothetical protein
MLGLARFWFRSASDLGAVALGLIGTFLAATVSAFVLWKWRSPSETTGQ